MRVPIQYALTYPGRMPGPVAAPDFGKLAQLDFFEPDVTRFPAVKLGFRAAAEGGTLGAVLNAANEVAVDEFLAGRIALPEIAQLVEAVMDEHNVVQEPTLEQVVEADAWARERAADGSVNARRR
jgi:1-deoxy-D-xylulose-5-phosphate reductoisomerase